MTLAFWHVRGSAEDFHARDVGAAAGPEVWRLDVDRPALVLGSRQRDDVVDLDACRSMGVEVVHRRSGGGVVYLEPGETLWVDVFVPRDDDRARDDVRNSMVWMGERWTDALDRVGVTGESAVHRGAMVDTRWSELICFAGVGPGEVLLDGRKLVGISQRRTRWGARFQCAVHTRWNPDGLVRLLAAPPPVDDLPAVATLDPGVVDDLAAALLAAVRTS